MTNIVKKIVTTIGEEEENPLVVTWDMEVSNDTPSNAHPDNPSQSNVETRDVNQIHRVEILLLNKQGLDVTNQFLGMGSSKSLRRRLEDKLLEAVEFENVNQLKQTA